MGHVLSKLVLCEVLLGWTASKCRISAKGVLDKQISLDSMAD